MFLTVPVGPDYRIANVSCLFIYNCTVVPVGPDYRIANVICLFI